MKEVFLIVLWFNALSHIKSQFITVGTTNIRNKVSKSSCEGPNKSVLVEQFFNIIFNEFHNTPPLCVCVQMCPDQPTYCYPNGCLKKVESYKKPETPVSRLENVNTKPVFFLEEKNDFINDFVNKNYVDENKATFVPVPFKQSNVMPINLRPDPFKDRYKILFKHKKMPKVELKYNLGEQVKNTKSDAINKETVDVSKTRWPRNKMNYHINGHRKHADANAHAESRFYISNNKEVVNYPPKYFKRELANNTNYDGKELDLRAIYVVGKTESDNTPFSLEKLIDSLIENSFDSNDTSNFTKDSDINVNYNTVNYSSNPVTETVITSTKENNTYISKSNNINTTSKVMSINFTDENIARNIYTTTVTETKNENSTRDINDMIASLSKRIEIKNNTSLEMMRRMSDEFDYDSTKTTTDKYVDTTTEKENVAIIPTETSVVSVEFDLKPTRKSRQKLTKRLINSKNN